MKKTSQTDAIKRVTDLILEKKGREIIVLDLRNVASFTDYMILCTADSTRQSHTISDHLLESLKKEKIKPLHIEGYNQAKWILMDYIEFIVNIFEPDTRSFYNLERLWYDAPLEKIEDPEK